MHRGIAILPAVRGTPAATRMYVAVPECSLAIDQQAKPLQLHHPWPVQGGAGVNMWLTGPAKADHSTGEMKTS
ncbi:MAG: hypothetical protein AAF485_15535, partial [Chloroflexota bacterium]